MENNQYFPEHSDHKEFLKPSDTQTIPIFKQYRSPISSFALLNYLFETIGIYNCKIYKKLAFLINHIGITCPWKGKAFYYTIEAGGNLILIHPGIILNPKTSQRNIKLSDVFNGSKRH